MATFAADKPTAPQTAVTASDPSLKTSGSVCLLGGEIASLTDEARRGIRYAVQNPADNMNPAVTVNKILRRTVTRQRLAEGKRRRGS